MPEQVKQPNPSRNARRKASAKALVCLALGSLASGGCTIVENKSTADLIQILLQQGDLFSWFICIGFIYLLWQAMRTARLLIKYSWRLIKNGYAFTFGWTRRKWITLLVLGTILWLIRNPLVESIQYYEQRYVRPVYVSQFTGMNAEHARAIYEAELSRRVDPYQKEIIVQRTRETAEKIRSTPLTIYEAAYLECGLNPFTVRRDRVAAGWIQFTRVGLGGLRYKQKPIYFDDVLEACASKDVGFIMDVTEIYLVDKYVRAGRQPLNNTIDLYLALFAPALIGAPSDRIVYQGYNNPSYYKNDGLDGWYVSDVGGRKQIFRKASQKDGKITIYEIFLALEAKKNRLLAQYLR